MSKFTVKTTVNNIIYDPKADSYSYTEELVSMKWTESNYSDRKKYQLGYGNESPSPAFKKYLKQTHFMDPDFGPDQLKDIKEN